MRHPLAWTFAALAAAGCGAQPSETAAVPASEAVAEHVPDVRTEEVAYEVDGVQLNGYLAWDAAREGERPGVLVVHEWWGQNQYPRRRARMLAEMGYTALALDMYGDGKLAEHPEDAQKFMMEVTSQLDVGVARFRAAHALLDEHPTTDPARTAAIGYCFGGGVVLHMARLGDDLAGVASFHGDLTARAEPEPGTVGARILVLHGADDPFVPEGGIEAFRAEMEAIGVSLELIEYPGAIHSFTNPAATEVGQRFEMPLAYDAEADEKSWAELDRFLQEIFAG